MRSFTNTITLSLTSILFAMNLAACDGGGGGGSSIKSDPRKVSSLEAAELQDVCADVFEQITPDQMRATAKVVCTLAGTLGGECTPATIEECTKEILAEMEQSASECDADLDVANCDITVGQLATCQLDGIALMAGAADKLTCENILTGGLPTEGPASCKIVEEHCPSALE